METVEPRLFSPEALAILDRMSFDPTVRGRYEWLSGGLIWPDEFPRAHEEWLIVARGYVYRFLIAYRASLTLGPECAEFRAVWEQVVRHAPNWPGLRPERRGERAARRLRVGQRRLDACLAELDSQSEADGKDT
jgi:hypothetical protein